MAVEKTRRAVGPGRGDAPRFRRWLPGALVCVLLTASCVVPPHRHQDPPPTIVDVAETEDDILRRLVIIEEELTAGLIRIQRQMEVLAEDIDRARELARAERAASSKDDGDFLNSTLFKIMILVMAGGIGAGAKPGYDKVREMRGGGD